MGFEMFGWRRIREHNHLKGGDIVPTEALHQVAPHLLQVDAHLLLLQEVAHLPHVCLQELHHLSWHLFHHLLELVQHVRHLHSNWSDLWSRWISQTITKGFLQKSSDISSLFHLFLAVHWTVDSVQTTLYVAKTMKMTTLICCFKNNKAVSTRHPWLRS